LSRNSPREPRRDARRKGPRSRSQTGKKGTTRGHEPTPAHEIRLQVFLARAGLGSRRACEQFILDGRVAVNGEGVIRMGVKVGPNDAVTVDGRKIGILKNRVYLALHKPRGYICANTDPYGRPLASDLFKSALKERLFHVGRLDFLSTGLIFYTNDGEFAKLVSHPSSGIEKEYLVEAARNIGDEFLERYKRGIRIEEETYRLTEYRKQSDRSALLTLLEGKNRELRNVFAGMNIRLKRVHRIRIGPVTLRGLAPGRFRKLTEKEVRWFFDHGSND
jgi:23S rRNA pseudouridine2605 synthase